MLELQTYRCACGIVRGITYEASGSSNDVALVLCLGRSGVLERSCVRIVGYRLECGIRRSPRQEAKLTVGAWPIVDFGRHPVSARLRSNIVHIVLRADVAVLLDGSHNLKVVVHVCLHSCTCSRSACIVVADAVGHNGTHAECVGRIVRAQSVAGSCIAVSRIVCACRSTVFGRYAETDAVGICFRFAEKVVAAA